jgi:hypothetical protein
MPCPYVWTDLSDWLREHFESLSVTPQPPGEVDACNSRQITILGFTIFAGILNLSRMMFKG